MNVTREAVHAALFTLGSAVGGFMTSSRVLQHWNSLSAGQFPAFYQAYVGESSKRVYNQPAIWTMDFRWYLYVQVELADTPTGPMTVLNPLLDALEKTLGAPPGYVGGAPQTLNGLVSHAWIEGDVETDEGTLGNTAVAIIPVKVLATS